MKELQIKFDCTQCSKPYKHQVRKKDIGPPKAGFCPRCRSDFRALWGLS
jgi:hypothetical protein